MVLLVSSLLIDSVQAQDSSWQHYMQSGNQAYAQWHNDEAMKDFSLAEKESEKFGASDKRLAISLDKLGQLHIKKLPIAYFALLKNN